MKKILLSIITILLLSACASYKMASLGPATRIYEVEGKSKEQLYNQSLVWLFEGDMYNKTTIEFHDRGAGIIVANYLLYSTTMVATNSFGTSVVQDNVYAKIKINALDNKIRFVIQPTEPWKWYYGCVQNYSKDNAIKDINALIDNYVEMLSTPEKW